jgi:tetratricopeptide (TPR) repeat protein
MTKSAFHAVILAVAAAVGGASFTTQAVAAQAVSAAVAKPLDAANKAIKAGKFDEAISKLREVGAASGKTAYDSYVMNQLLSYVLLKQNKFADAVPVLEAILNSGLAPGAEKTTINKQLLGIYFSQKNYAKTIEIGQGLIASGTADNVTYGAVAQSYERQGKLGDAVKFVKSRIDGAVSKGAKPAENELLMLLDYQRRLKDDKGQVETFEKLLAYYPKGDYWENLIPPLLRAPGNSDALTLGIYRLMLSTGTLKKAEDYTEMAQLAKEQGSAGEALEVLQKGLSSNVYIEQRDKDRSMRLLDAIKKQAAADQAALPKADADAKAGKSGDADVAVGSTYYGLGQYDKAIEVLKRGIGKGGLATPEAAQTLLGVALYRQKRTAEADAAFKAVKGDPKWVRVANLWAIHAR